MDERLIYKNLEVNEQGHLQFAGLDVVDLAREYGTPAYLLDEDTIIENCNTYKSAMVDYFGEGSLPLFASKALCCKGIYRLMSELDMGIDIVSPGELYTAVKSGFDMSKAFYHGSNKTDSDIELGLDSGVGYFIVDNTFELDELDRQCSNRKCVQKILIRVTPGIDPHTHEKINTGKVDSKFGAPIETGEAERLLELALGKDFVEVCGFHCHVGSQVFETEPFSDAARIMLEFISNVKKTHGFETRYLNLGGGFGVKYTPQDPQIDYRERICKLAGEIKQHCIELDIQQPKILMEPGRSIVGAAGLTIYEVGAIKKIEGFKNYVSIDGGMTDNIRYTLYGSPYTCVLANKMNEACDFKCTLAGRCCESGDLIQEDVLMPEPCRGDIVAVMTTGAYNYSMASNYNRVPRPPIIAIRKQESRVMVERETLSDLCRLDV